MTSRKVSTALVMAALAAMVAANAPPAEAQAHANGKIAFFSARGRTNGLYVMNPDVSEQTRISAARDTDPAWSPDGTKIAFHRFEDFEVGTARIY